MNIERIDFSNGFKCSDDHLFGKLNNFSRNIFELGFYQDQIITWKHKLIPIEISKSVSDRIIDLLLNKNHYVLIKKLNVFLGNHKCKYVCRQ